MYEDRPFPYDIDLEKSILGCLFHYVAEQNKEDFKLAITKLTEQVFYHPPNRTVFAKFAELVEDEIYADSLIMATELRKDDVLEEIGGEVFLIELEQFIATTVDINYYIKQVKELKYRRDIINQSYKLVNDSYSLDIPITNLKSAISEIVVTSNQKLSFEKKDMNEVMKGALSLIQASQSDDNNYIVKTGIKDIDDSLTLLRKQMLVLGGASGTGKTAFALTCMISQARIKVRTIYFCGESTSHELMVRILCVLSGFSFTDFIDGIVSKNKSNMIRFKQALEDYEQNIKGWIVIYGKGDYEHSAVGIAEAFRVESLTNQFDEAYFDYLQNMKAPDGITDTFQAISKNV